MEEVFSIHTDGNGNIYLMVAGDDVNMLQLRDDSEQAFVEGVIELLGPNGENLHNYLY